MTRTAMIRKDLQERATRERELPGYQAENPKEVIPPHTYARYTRTDTYEIYDTLHKSSATELPGTEH